MNFNLRVGHHGLFAEPMAGAGQSFDTQALALRVGRPSISHNRNRTYDPHLGRFLQHDPNGTGQTLSGLAFEGKLGWTPPSAFDHSAWFGDGGNLYAAYGHDPVNATDPSGLFIFIDLLLGPTETVEIYQDYNDDVLDNGMGAFASVDAMLQDAVWGQLDAIDSLLAWDGPDVGMWSVSGMIPLGGLQSHHVIPRFLYGLGDAANRLNLPESEHGRYHRILEEEFRIRELPAPNSRGPRNWRERLERGEVKPDQIEKVKDALRTSGRRFDQLTGHKYKLEAKIVENLVDHTFKPPLKNKKRRRR